MIGNYNARIDYGGGTTSQWFAAVIEERKVAWKTLNERLIAERWEPVTEAAIQRRFPRYSLDKLGFYTRSSVLTKRDNRFNFGPTELDEYRFRRQV